MDDEFWLQCCNHMSGKFKSPEWDEFLQNCPKSASIEDLPSFFTRTVQSKNGIYFCSRYADSVVAMRSNKRVTLKCQWGGVSWSMILPAGVYVPTVYAKYILPLGRTCFYDMRFTCNEEDCIITQLFHVIWDLKCRHDFQGACMYAGTKHDCDFYVKDIFPFSQNLKLEYRQDFWQLHDLSMIQKMVASRTIVGFIRMIIAKQRVHDVRLQPSNLFHPSFTRRRLVLCGMYQTAIKMSG